MAVGVTFPGIDAARTGLLVVFSGDVLKRFRERAVMMGTHLEKTISSGKSAQFPIMGRAEALYHAPGNDIFTDLSVNAIGTAQRLISIDRVLVAPVFIDELETKLSHWGDRQMFAAEAADALARAFDSHTIRVLFAASATSPGDVGKAKGGNMQDVDFRTNGASAAATIFRAAEEMDKRDLPKMDRFVIVPPEAYYRLTQQTELITKDNNPPNGSLAEGEIVRVAGIRVLESTNIPTGAFEAASPNNDPDSPGSNVSTNLVFNNPFGVSGTTGQYDPDSAATVHGLTSWDDLHALAFHKSAIGTLKAMDVTTEADYYVERQGWLLVAKYAMGHGVLRPEAALSISDAADADLV